MSISPTIWTVVSIAQLFWVGVATVFIVMQRRSAQATLAWIFVLAFLPFLGFAVYVFLGPRRFERQRARRARAHAHVRGLALDDEEGDHQRSTQSLNLMHLCANAGGIAAAPRTADVEIFLDGRSKYAALETAIGNAKHHVHCECYIWEPDTIGTRIRDALADRAKAGVEVRVLVDGFGSSKAHDRFWAPLREQGGEVRRFNELSLNRWRPRMANFRTHRKIVVIDAEVGFVGGMNICDVHTSEVSGAAAWRDTHLMMRGPAVKGLQLVFFEDWLYASGTITNEAKYLRGSHDLPPGDRLLQVVASGPDENLDAIHKLFFSAIAGAHERVLLTTPYFVPDEALLAALATAALRGADVQLLVPFGGDVPLVAAAARTYFPELLEIGVRVYEYGPPVLHSKTLVVDDDLAVVGTANTDNRSFRLNFEVVVANYDGDACGVLASAFESDLEHAQEITLEMLSKEPFSRRLFAASARLFSPIL